MTVIVAWLEDNVPFLVGDFMVTSEPQGFQGDHFEISTRDDLHEKLPSHKKIKVHEPVQKVYKISDNFAVAWCGALMTARDLLFDLQYTFSNKNPTISEVATFLKSLNYQSEPECIVIGWVIDKGIPVCFRWQSNRPGLLDFNDKFIEGSGSEEFAHVFSPFLRIGDDPIEGAITRVAHILKDEVLYGSNLEKRFGGGFQFLYFDGIKFVTIRDVLYFFMQLEAQEDGSLGVLSPKRFLKFLYDESIIQIMAILPSEKSLGFRDHLPEEQVSTKMFFVPKIDDAGKTFIVNASLPFHAEYYSICLDIRTLDKPPIILELSFACSENKRKTNKFINITDKSGVEEFVIEDEFWQRILKSVNKK